MEFELDVVAADATEVGQKVGVVVGTVHDELRSPKFYQYQLLDSLLIFTIIYNKKL